ncbi:MAG: hypothetical protein KKD69_07325 [Euryarchaeota archaeon]|nr:hypothetical protein [Euryarchaeota archaeon]MBU4492256.1 hypothetical protein [Euryarchaeota archaeon]
MYNYNGGFKGARKLPISIVEMNCPFVIIIPVPEKQLSRLDFRTGIVLNSFKTI